MTTQIKFLKFFEQFLEAGSPLIWFIGSLLGKPPQGDDQQTGYLTS